MTDEATTPDTEETTLDEEQLARSEALFHARALLVGDMKIGAPFASNQSEQPLSSRKTFAVDLILLSNYILDGAEVLEGYAEEHTCPGNRCACEIAAEFTGGEDDVPREIVQVEPGNPRIKSFYTYADLDIADEIKRAMGADVHDELETETVRQRATESELYRYAQKRDVSLRDAYSYFEDQGYDMSEVKSMEFDSTVPNEQEQEGNL